MIEEFVPRRHRRAFIGDEIGLPASKAGLFFFALAISTGRGGRGN
jgi:hypothetical protein